MRLGFWKTDDKSYGRQVYVVAIDDQPVAWLMRCHAGHPARDCVDNDPHYWDLEVYEGAEENFDGLGFNHFGSYCSTLAAAKTAIERRIAIINAEITR
jgi:hypothetical protein